MRTVADNARFIFRREAMPDMKVKCKVLESLSVKRNGKDFVIARHTIIPVAAGKLFELLKEGKVEPAEPVALKFYSNFLKDHIWLVPDDDMAEKLRKEGVEDAIYTPQEIKEFRNGGRELLEMVHDVKKNLDGSKVQKIQKIEKENNYGRFKRNR